MNNTFNSVENSQRLAGGYYTQFILYPIDLQIILLSTAGTIFNPLKSILAELGVPKQKIRSLMQHLQIQAA
jgi:hypothetical protein